MRTEEIRDYGRGRRAVEALTFCSLNTTSPIDESLAWRSGQVIRISSILRNVHIQIALGRHGNGTEILQESGLVVIRNEIIHETRIIPIDPRDKPQPHLPSAIRSYMGDSHGHWEGDTLVVDTTNFIAALHHSECPL